MTAWRGDQVRIARGVRHARIKTAIRQGGLGAADVMERFGVGRTLAFELIAESKRENENDTHGTFEQPPRA
jgi:hypothetical protein